MLRPWILAIGFATITVTDAASLGPNVSDGSWQSFRLPERLPAALGNEYADRDDAAALGLRIFFDNRFSKNGSGVSCASCHDPEHSFSELKPRSKTLSEVARNAPDLIDAAWYSKSHFWDGKVDTLWSAPLFTFEQVDEMGSSRLQVVHVLSAIYKARYERIFGPMPDISDTTRFPISGKPGLTAFDSMSSQDQLIVNQIYANAGKALEAYLRKLAAGRSAFDDFLGGAAESLNPAAQRGMQVFARSGCGSCHSGPTFTDEKFHNIGIAAAPGHADDLGREEGITFARQWPFNSTGQFASGGAVEPGRLADDSSSTTHQRGAFRTPSLRNVAVTPPYGHDGIFDTLDQVIDAHAQVLPQGKQLAAQDKSDIVAFLRSLTGRPPQRPWNYWPGG